MKSWMRRQRRPAKAGGYFVRLSEDSAGDYGTAVRRAVYALWSGKLDKDGFLEQMEATIDRGLRRAWNDGLKAVGIKPKDMTSAEELEIGKIVLNQYDFTGGFADFILDHSKANKGKLADLQARASTWVNRYTEVYNQAMLSGRDDPKLEWVINPLKEHCDSCLKLNGIVKRASFWQEAGIIPAQAGADYLDCKGFKCGCKYQKTDKDITPGPLPALP